MSGAFGSGRSNVLLGVVRIAVGRPDGIACFANTPQAFLVSLAPMGGLLLAGVAQGIAMGVGIRILGETLPPLCALLAPSVISHEFARLWHRQASWLRFATAMNWCQLALPFIGMALLVLVSMAKASGLPPQTANVVLVLGLGGYAMWMHWFLARHGLNLGSGRSALLVLGVNFGTALLVFGPRLLFATRE